MDDIVEEALDRQRREVGAETRPPAELPAILATPTGDAVLCPVGDIAGSEDGAVTAVASGRALVADAKLAFDLEEVR